MLFFRYLHLILFIVMSKFTVLLNALSLLLAIKSKCEFGTRQLLREYEGAYVESYGKTMLIRTLPLLTVDEREWLRGLY